jgi:hypothetical protein
MPPPNVRSTPGISKLREGLVYAFDHSLGWIPVLGSFFLACDVDKSFEEPGKKDGTGIINFLALFVVTQGAFLAASAKDADIAVKVYVLLGIYLTLSLITISGLVLILRLTTTKGQNILRTFDRVTIVYGRFILISTLLITLLLASLAYFGLLPGMKIREQFEKKEIPTLPKYLSEVRAKNWEASWSLIENDKYHMEKWIAWIDEAMRSKTDLKCIWLEQQGTFGKQFRTIHAELQIDPDYRIVQKVAFLKSSLVREDGITDRYRPVFRQLPFNHEGYEELNTFEIANPETQEGLVLILVIGPIKKPAQFPDVLERLKLRVTVTHS